MKDVIYVPMDVDQQTLEGPVDQMLKVLKPDESAVNMTDRNVRVGIGIHIGGKHADVRNVMTAQKMNSCFLCTTPVPTVNKSI